MLKKCLTFNLVFAVMMLWTGLDCCITAGTVLKSDPDNKVVVGNKWDLYDIRNATDCDVVGDIVMQPNFNLVHYKVNEASIFNFLVSKTPHSVKITGRCTTGEMIRTYISSFSHPIPPHHYKIVGDKNHERKIVSAE